MTHFANDNWNAEGIREHYLFFGDLGGALTQWASLEMAIFWMFRDAFGHTDKAQAAQVYYAANFHEKIGMTSRALEIAKAPSDVLQDWKRLAGQAREQAKIRNKLAHWTVIVFPHLAEGQRYRLQPATAQDDFKGALMQADFQPIWARFNELAAEIEDLRHRWHGSTAEFTAFGRRRITVPLPGGGKSGLPPSSDDAN